MVTRSARAAAGSLIAALQVPPPQPVAQQQCRAGRAAIRRVLQQRLDPGGAPRSRPSRCGSHHRSSTGQGPAHQRSRSCRPRATSHTGSVENSPRPVTRTGLRSASRSSTGSSSSTAGDGSGSRPGHGWRGSAIGTSSSPAGSGDALRRPAATGQHRHPHRLRAEQALHPHQCPAGRSRPLHLRVPTAAAAVPRSPRALPPAAAVAASPGRWAGRG